MKKDTFILSNDTLSNDQYLYNKVIRYILQYHNFLLSYSGGLDSTVLLDILTTVKKNIHLYTKTVPVPLLSLRAVYVHHGLNSKADDWANHCFQQCKIRNIPFDVLYINCNNINNGKKHNVEGLARMLRYQALYNYLNSDEVLLTAHHMDDQVETILLALKRGSGPTGLSGISKNILYNNNCQLLRPLLKCSRIQLEKYAYRKKLIWVNDDSNMNIYFDRNFLRMQIIPLLQNRWPFFKKSVVRVSKLCRDQENLLYELLHQSLNKLVDIDGSLFFYPLLKYSASKRRTILRYWLHNFLVNMPSYNLLNCIWKEAVLSKIDSNPILCLGKQHICRRFRKKLYILPINMMSPIKISVLHWKSLDNTILLPNKLGLLVSQSLTLTKDMNSFQEILKSHIYLNASINIFNIYFNKPGKILTHCLVRSPNFNEKVSIRFGSIFGLLNILNRDRSRKLKKIWQEYNIPPWLRTRIPLLFYNDILISAIGVFITKNGVYTNKTIFKLKNKNHYVAKRVIWVQDISYYNCFRNVIHGFLK